SRQYPATSSQLDLEPGIGSFLAAAGGAPRPVGGRGARGLGGLEDSVCCSAGGFAVVQFAEALGEPFVGGGVGAVDVVDRAEGLDHLVGRLQQRAGRLVLEVEVEAAQLVPRSEERRVGKEWRSRGAQDP